MGPVVVVITFPFFQPIDGIYHRQELICPPLKGCSLKYDFWMDDEVDGKERGTRRKRRLRSFRRSMCSARSLLKMTAINNMSSQFLHAAFSGFALAFAFLTESAAQEIVGNRFFRATLGTDDPGVNDELSIPTISAFKTGNDPSFKQRDISGEFSKRITEAFAVSFGSTYTHLSSPVE